MYFIEEQIEMKENLSIVINSYSWLLLPPERKLALYLARHGKFEQAQDIIDKALNQLNNQAPDFCHCSRV